MASKYLIKKSKMSNGDTIWLVPSRNHPLEYGLGTTIHHSLADAKWQAGFNNKLDKQDKERDKTREKYLAEAKAAKDKREDTKGFADRYSPIQKARIIKVLQNHIRMNGIIDTRLKHIINCIRKGYKVQTKNDRRIFISPTGSFLIEKDLTKTGMDFAQYLSRKK